MRPWPVLLALVGLVAGGDRAAHAQEPPPVPQEVPPVEEGEPPPVEGGPPPGDAADDATAPAGDAAAGPDAASGPDAAAPADGSALAPDAGPTGFELGEGGDSEFGPLILIERIRIVGNRATAERVIRRALPLAAGDVMRAGDPRLSRARFKLLALGYFRDVDLRLEKGTARGRVVLTVTVTERGTIVLNQLWFGTSALAPWWLGADLTERNFLGSGLSLGAGFAYADAGAVIGSRDQWAGELRLGGRAIGGSRWSVHGAFTGQRGADPYRIGGADDSNRPDDFRAFSYRRLGVRAGVRRQLLPGLQVHGRARVESIEAALPVAPTRTLPDGRAVAIDLGLRQGASRVVSVRFGLDRDTRTDPVLPRGGSRLQLTAELGATLLGGSYDFTTLMARGERWWPVAARHSIGVRAAGGVILGDAPRFDRIHVADVDRLLTPRALGLTVASGTAHDLLGTGNAGVVHGDVGGNLLVEWSYRWFRRSKAIYGGDLFVAAGVWSLTTADDLRTRDRALASALPLDAVLDAGLRLDTELGVFEFTIANAVGRFSR